MARPRPDAQPDPTRRFANRVDDYARFRPRYPRAVVDVLREEVGFAPGWVVADVGSGTGISTELFLDHGNAVHAIEPNAEMRRAAEQHLGRRPNFRSVDGRAEATTLAGASADLVSAMQAFHWFDHAAVRREFARILRPGGYVVLVWNDRSLDATPFLREYEALLVQLGTDYQTIRNDKIPPAAFARFFGPAGYRERSVPNHQEFDFEGLKGRLLSSSYAPAAGQPGHEPMLAALRQAFDAHQSAGRVRFQYLTRIYFGPLS